MWWVVYVVIGINCGVLLVVKLNMMFWFLVLRLLSGLMDELLWCFCVLLILCVMLVDCFFIEMLML